MPALIAAVVVLASDAPTLDLERPVTSMTRLELQAEYARLEELRPGVGGPIALISIGGGIALVGGMGLLNTLTNSFGPAPFTASNPGGFFFLAAVMAGAAFLTTGTWFLWSRREERARLGARMDVISERLDGLNERRVARPRRGGRAAPTEPDVPPQL